MVFDSDLSISKALHIVKVADMCSGGGSKEKGSEYNDTCNEITKKWQRGGLSSLAETGTTTCSQAWSMNWEHGCKKSGVKDRVILLAHTHRKKKSKVYYTAAVSALKVSVKSRRKNMKDSSVDLLPPAPIWWEDYSRRSSSSLP